MSQPKKAGGRGKKAGNKHTDEKGEDVLQAVVLADSFQDRFQPLTIDTPRCLLPLANTPLLDYTLEYLAMNGVQEVFIYVSAHASQIESYLASSPRWATAGLTAGGTETTAMTSTPAATSSTTTTTTCPFQSLELIRVAQATSLGDFLRDLDKRGIMEGDFVLVHGDLVANVPLDPILARHRARREANRDAIMTLVLAEVGGQEDDDDEEDDDDDDDDDRDNSKNKNTRPPRTGAHRTHPHAAEPLFVLDATTGRCLEYDEMTPLDRSAERRLTVDAAFVAERNADIEVRADLLDTGIDICTPDVLALWTESFDCDLPRKNFLHNVLKDWELNGKLVYADVQPARGQGAGGGPGGQRDKGQRDDRGQDSYAARASSLQMYDSISRDVLGRWTFPFVPESNLLPGHSYRSLRHGLRHNNYSNSYRHVVAERGVQVDPSAAVASAVLGLHTAVGAGSVIVGSTLGRRCRIGRHVRIDHCYLWDDVVVGDHAVISHSILAHGVAVAGGSVVPPGSVLGAGVSVAEGAALSDASSQAVTLSRLARHGSPVADDASVVGAGGRGAPFQYDSDAGDDADDADADSDDGRGGGWAAAAAEQLQRSLVFSTAHLNVSTSSISSFGEYDSDFDDEHAVLDDEDDKGGLAGMAGLGGGAGGEPRRRGGGGGSFLSPDGLVLGAAGSRSRLSSFTSVMGDGGLRGSGSGSIGSMGAGSAGGIGGMRAGDGMGSSADNDGVQLGGSSFHADAVHGLLDALRDASSSDFESARLEFMSLRLATDASDGSVRRAVATAFARRAAELSGGCRGGSGGSTEKTSGSTETSETLAPSRAAEKTVKGQRGAARFVREVGLGGQGSKAEQVDFVLTLQRTFVGLRIRQEQERERAKTETTETTEKTVSHPPGTLLAALLQQFYDNDVLEEEGILAWWADKRATVGGSSGSGRETSMAEARERCQVLVAWLETAEEDDSDDSDESGESESESESDEE